MRRRLLRRRVLAHLYPSPSQHVEPSDATISRPSITQPVVADKPEHSFEPAFHETLMLSTSYEKWFAVLSRLRAYYSPKTDRIQVPDPARFATAGDYWATVLHELAHWTGHESRLDRDLSSRFGSDAYGAEELVAELAAAFLCADLSVPGKLQHEEYLGSWLSILRADTKAIFTAARLAQEAADYLTGKLACNESVPAAVAA